LQKDTERIQLKKEICQLRHKVVELAKGWGFASIIGESQALKDILNLGRRVTGPEGHLSLLIAAPFPQIYWKVNFSAI
jgi:hypothetical protein